MVGLEFNNPDNTIKVMFSRSLSNNTFLERAYCAFNIFHKVNFCLAFYTEEVNEQTFVMIQCLTICQNYLCTISFVQVIGFYKMEYFHFFPIVKMNANYAEISRVGNLEADFQKVPLVQFF